MPDASLTVLVVGATGSIGRVVVEEALAKGHTVRALIRDPAKAGKISYKAQVVVGDVTQPETLGAFLMSEADAFITGADFLIDGGATASHWYGELAPKASTTALDEPTLPRDGDFVSRLGNWRWRARPSSCSARPWTVPRPLRSREAARPSRPLRRIDRLARS